MKSNSPLARLTESPEIHELTTKGRDANPVTLKFRCILDQGHDLNLTRMQFWITVVTLIGHVGTFLRSDLIAALSRRRFNPRLGSPTSCENEVNEKTVNIELGGHSRVCGEPPSLGGRACPAEAICRTRGSQEGLTAHARRPFV